MGVQFMLDSMVSLKTPLRYPGAKSRAVRKLLEFVPRDVKEVVSPFFGGGSLELAMTGRGVRVHGYDLFPPIAIFWRVLQSEPIALSERIQVMLSEYSPDEFVEFQRGRFWELESELDRAAMFLILCNLGWNGRAMRVGGLSRYSIDSDGVPRLDYGKGNQVLIRYERIREFHNPLVSVREMDYRDSLSLHRDAFAYFDPPYPTDYHGVYGDSAEYHERFDHQELAWILYGRKNWMLSYNDTELVRELYPQEEFRWDYVTWNHTSRSKGRCKGDDVVIRPKACAS